MTTNFKLVNTLIITVLLLVVSNVNAKTVDARWDGVSDIIARVSYESGEDPVILAGFVSAESSFRGNVKAKTSSAGGHVQFITSTWRRTVKTYGHLYGLNRNASRFDPYANLAMGAELTKQNRSIIEPVLKRRATGGELYIAHVLSPEGMLKLYRAKPNASAALLFPKAAAANKKLFYYKNGTARPVVKFKRLMTDKYYSNAKQWEAKAKASYASYVKKKSPRMVVKTCPYIQPKVAPVEQPISLLKTARVAIKLPIPNNPAPARVIKEDKGLTDRRRYV